MPMQAEARSRLRWYIPIFSAAIFNVLPLKPPLHLAILAVALALFALLMLGCCIYDIVRPHAVRPAIPLVWLGYAAGMGCVSFDLWLMAQTWNAPRATKPLETGFILLLVGGACLTAASIGFWQVCANQRIAVLSSPEG